MGFFERTFMNSYSFFMILLSFVYALFLLIYYHNKPKIDSLDLKNFGSLIGLNFAGIFLELINSFVFILIGPHNILAVLANKVYLIILGFYNALLMFMSVYVSLSKEQLDKRYKRIVKIKTIVYILIAIFVLVLPINCINDPSGVYSDGPAASFLGIFGFFSGVVLLTYSLYGIIKNHVSPIKYIPFWTMSTGILFVFFIQSINRHYTLVSVLETFIIFIMFFTIENPDVQIIDKLRNTRKIEEDANEEKTNFLSSMSHELRTPLNAIIGFTQDIEDLNNSSERDKEIIDEDIHFVLQASNSFVDIIDINIEINQVESSEKVLKEEKYTLLDEFSSSIEECYSKMQEKSIAIKLNAANDIPKELIGDRDVLSKIIKHLLSNALKYTDTGEINIDVDYEKESQTLLLHVRDTGRGIPLDQQESIFKSFERGADVRNSNIQGTGLGLAIVKNLVDLSHGELTLESEVGKGSNFFVKIPQKNVE